MVTQSSMDFDLKGSVTNSAKFDPWIRWGFIRLLVLLRYLLVYRHPKKHGGESFFSQFFTKITGCAVD